MPAGCSVVVDREFASISCMCKVRGINFLPCSIPGAVWGISERRLYFAKIAGPLKAVQLFRDGGKSPCRRRWLQECSPGPVTGYIYTSGTRAQDHTQRIKNIYSY